MADIEIRETHDFDEQVLADLFLSVGWSSGHYPDRLVAAMKGFECVYAAWADDELVGLVCAMDDHAMTAYVHYLLVRPEFQSMGIGRDLVMRVRERYADYLRVIVIAYDAQIEFYERCGFKRSETSSPLFITSLWT